MDEQSAAAPVTMSNSNQDSISHSAPSATITEASSTGPSNARSEVRRSDSKDFSKGNQGGHRRDRPGKKRDMGRSEWSKKKGDKRKRNDDEQAAKRQRLDRGEKELPIYAQKFSDDVLQAEERRPKKKVAVLIGYAGTGYKGMQLAHDQKTIEGDLFQAFVAAGAISKANADDPKKSSFVRCARTDKGVHAAGNVISLKLIVEDEDIVKKINENLVSQIRVWGYERTSNSFSAYQLVDSRIYEYLIPTHSFLPPHPRSFMGRKCEEWAQKKDDTEQWKKRQEEVQGFWEKVDEEMIKPILEEYDEETRSILEKALYLHGDESVDGIEENTSIDQPEGEAGKAEASNENVGDSNKETNGNEDSNSSRKSTEILEAIKKLRHAYITAKRAYRIPKSRFDRVQEALNLYVGTRNYHNYTVQKTFKDPSSKRVIKSFLVNPQPILINGTEWLSLKVHGQSFMMHQIRKMVGMIALLVRCGCDLNRMIESFGPDRISIPKAPSLGLLLERPVFDSYNRRAKTELSKETIDFDKYKAEMDEFKQREIYERMYRDEEKDNIFGNFFNNVDNFPNETFLFVTSGGIEATKTKIDSKQSSANGAGLVDAEADEDSDDDLAVNDANGDEG